MDAASFYDDIAPSWDQITALEARLQRDKAVIAALVRKFRIQRALDVGCGTGASALLLAKLGVETTGIDVSSRMIKQAKTNAIMFGCSLTFFVENCAESMHTPPSPYDAICVLGNTLVHVLEPAALRQVLENFRDRLAANGVIIIQVLNYAKILAKKERIINIRREKDTLYVRFYDFHDDRLQLNILTIKESGAGFSHDIQDTRHYPWQLAELVEIAGQVGLRCDAAGTLTGDPFDSAASTNLVVYLHREFSVDTHR